MPNICTGNMVVRGRKENVQEFIQILKNNYDKEHMFRIFESDVFEEEFYGMIEKAYIFFNCAWSVSCCMMPGKLTYYDDYIDLIKDPEYAKVHTGKGTNLIELSKRLNLDIYILSEGARNVF